MARDLNLNVLLKAVDKATKPLKDINKSSGKAAEALKASRKELRQLEDAQKNLRGFKDLKRQSVSTANALHDEQKRVAALTREIRDTDGPTKRLTQSRNKAIRQARRLKQQYRSEQEQLAAIRNKLRAVDGLTGTYADQQRELARRVEGATRQIHEQQQALTETARRQKAAAAASRRYAKAQSRASSMVTGGAGALATGGAALYGAGRMLAPGVSYGEQMSELRAVTGLGKRSGEYRMLARQARDLGSSTQFTATEAGGAQTFLARAGLSPQAIHASLQAVLNEALVGGIDLPRAADISSNIAGVFQIDTEQAGAMTRVVDTLTAASTHANVNIEMLGETMKYLGQASDLHVSMEQAAALAGILGNVGIQGSQVGTTLRQMMVRLTAPTAKAKKAIKELGLELKDSQGNLKSLPDILAQIDKATAGMGNVKRSQLLSDLFQARAGSGVAALVNNLPQLTALLGNVKNATGAAQEAADVMADNVGGDLKSLSSAWQEVGISITQTNEGPLREFIQNLTAITRGIGDWIKANPGLASTLAKIAAGVATLITLGGGLVLTLGSILGPIAMVKYALTTLRFAAMLNPVTGALTLLAAAAYLIYRNWGSISEFFQDRWADIKTAFSAGTGAVAKLLLNWNPIGLIYRGITAGLAALGVNVPKQFRSLGAAIVDGIIGGIGDMAGALKDKITGLASSVGGWFKSTLGIHSPSRVFAGYGQNTVEGYRLGLEHNEPRVLGQIGAMGRRIKQAGAGGLALAGGLGTSAAAGAQTPLASNPVAFDQRPALQAPARAGGGDVHYHVSIGDIHAGPGMDEQALAHFVAAEVERKLADFDNQRAARGRSALYDRD